MNNSFIWNFEELISSINQFELGIKVRSETGDVYKLSQAEGEGKQRKFSRWNGTKLRFMTYENIGKKFEILKDNTEDIEEFKGETFEQLGYEVGKLSIAIAKGFEKAIKELRKDNINE